MPDSNIVIYGADWCVDCRRARRFLDQNQIPYTWINIDQDEEAEKFVFTVNHGYRSIPTILFPDGSILVEPTNSQLSQKLSLTVP